MKPTDSVLRIVPMPRCWRSGIHASNTTSPTSTTTTPIERFESPRRGPGGTRPTARGRARRAPTSRSRSPMMNRPATSGGKRRTQLAPVRERAAPARSARRRAAAARGVAVTGRAATPTPASRYSVACGCAAEDRRRARGRDRSVQRVAHRHRLARLGHDREHARARAASAGIVTVIACVGTSSIVAKWPSATCWRRDAGSSATIFTSTGSSKSATGGSLNARWPFSPIPQQQRSSGCVAEQRRVAIGLGLRVAGVAREVVELLAPGAAPRPARACSAGSSRSASAAGRRTRPCGTR